MSKEYDIDMIIDTEGTEGLQKIYSDFSQYFVTINMPNPEWDFTINYFGSKYKSVLNYLGLNSIFESEIPGLTENIREKFKRRETLWKNLTRANDVYSRILKFNAKDDKNCKRSYLNTQVMDSYIDVLIVKNALDISVRKENADKMQEVSIDNIIEDYGSLLKSYVDNKKFMKKDGKDQMRIIQKNWSELTSDRLEDVITSYNIHHENTEKHFQKLKDRILDSKEMPFGVMFEEQKRYGWKSLKNFLIIAGLTVPIISLAGGCIGSVALALKGGLVFSSYITGGCLFAGIYLNSEIIGGLTNLGDKIMAKNKQKVVNINTPLKNTIINDKNVYKDIIP